MRNHTCLCSAPSSVSHTDDDIDSFLDGSGTSSILRHDSEPRSQTEISRECPGERIVQRCTQGSTNLPENGMRQSLAISICKDLPKDQRSRSSRQLQASKGCPPAGKPRRSHLTGEGRHGGKSQHPQRFRGPHKHSPEHGSVTKRAASTSGNTNLQARLHARCACLLSALGAEDMRL